MYYTLGMETNTNILTADQIESMIFTINSIVRPQYRTTDGEYPSSMFGLRCGESWIFEFEARGLVEICARYTLGRRPVLLSMP